MAERLGFGLAAGATVGPLMLAVFRAGFDQVFVRRTQRLEICPKICIFGTAEVRP
jgi:hypothetical protein